MIKSRSQEHRYICFDGDIDPVWIENMNTVMDDNRLLTLANGERIRLEAHCSILFEESLIVSEGFVFAKCNEFPFEFRWVIWSMHRPQTWQDSA